MSTVHNKKVFTQEQINYIIDSFVNKNISSVTLSKEFSCDSKVIRRVLQENNVDTSKTGFITKELIEKIIYSHDVDKISLRQLTKMYNISQNYLSKLLKENGVVLRVNKVEFSDNDVQFIINEYVNNKKSIKEIASILGNAPKLISNVLTTNNIEIKTFSPVKDSLDINFIKKEFLNGKGISTIAKELNVAYLTIENILIENGLKELSTLDDAFDERYVVTLNKGKFTFNQFQTDFIIKKYKEGNSSIKIANFLKVNTNSIINHLRENDVIVLNVNKKTFSNDDETYICNEYENGNLTMLALAEKFNVHQSVIKRTLDENNIEIYKRSDNYNKINLDNKELEYLISSYKNNIPIYNICDNLGITSTVLYRILKENNIEIYNRLTRIFSDEEKIDIISKFLDEKLPVTSIAKFYNIAPSAITNILNENNIEIVDHRHYVFSEDESEYIINEYISKNKSGIDLANEMNCSYHTIYRFLTKNNIPVLDRNVLSFSEDEIKYIIESYKTEYKLPKQLAKEFNVSLFSIYKILKENNVEIFAKFNTSNEENLLRFILKYFIPDISELGNRIILDGKEIDIVSENKKVGIEYNGLWHHRTSAKYVNYHLDKTTLASSKGYKLIQIFSDEFIHNPVLTINRILKSIRIPYYITTEFYESFEDCYYNNTELNIQPSTKTPILFSDCKVVKTEPTKTYFQFYTAFGLLKEYNETVNNVNYNIEHSDYGIIGYISINKITNTIENLFIEDEFNVKGLNSSLFNDYISEFKPTDLYFDIDKRFSPDIENLSSLGFEFVQHTEPRTHYFKNYTRHIASETTNIELESDVEWNELHDCGCLRYELIK